MQSEIINDTRSLVSSLEPLLFSCIKSSAHHSLDEIRISTGRAREIHQDLSRLKRRLKELERPQLARDNRLDAIFHLA
jgi:hypothetical protein